MFLPLMIVILSAAGIGAALAVPGLADLMLLAGPCLLAGLILLLRARLARPRPAPRHILIDGSNVMHWQDNSPQVATLRAVIEALESRGYVPGVVFDANAGYLLAGRYQHDDALGRLLGLPEDRVMVVAKGTPADAVLLQAARDLGARIVTNDRYRDWAEAHPEVRDAGFLVRGGFREGEPWLNLDEGGDPRADATGAALPAGRAKGRGGAAGR
jgi:hypothetical protein